MIQLLLAASFGYLLGSIPFGYLLTRFGGAGDIRAVGSGNIGATNVLRTGRRGLAAATLLLDASKGAVAALLAARAEDPLVPLVAGSAAVLGHCTSVWMGGRGGKGGATGLGVLLAWAWPVGLACAAAWAATLALTRISSASTLLATALAPVLLLAMRTPASAAAGLFVTALIFLRHHQNIARLLAGTEPRIGRNPAK